MIWLSYGHSRGWSSGTRPFLKQVGALVRCPDDSSLPCFLPGDAREELILFSAGPGGGREDPGTPKGFRKIWG